MRLHNGDKVRDFFTVRFARGIAAEGSQRSETERGLVRDLVMAISAFAMAKLSIIVA